MKCLLIILLLCCANISFSQEIDTTLQQLEDKLKTAISQEERINATLNLGEYELDHNFSKGKQLINDTRVLLESKENPNLSQLAKTMVLKGVISRRQAHYPKALEFYFKAKTIYEHQNDIWNVSDVYHNMGMVYRYQKNLDKAISFFKKSIKIKDSLNDIHGLGAGYNMMGASYNRKMNPDSALICYAKAKKYFTAIPSPDDLQRVNNNLAKIYMDSEDWNKALEMYETNITYAKKFRKKMSLCTTYYSLAKLYYKKDSPSYNKALMYADSSLFIAQTEGFRQRISKAFLRKSYIYNLSGNYKAAYDNYRTFNRHSDSIFNIENIKKTQELELNYQYQKERLSDSLAFVQERNEIALKTKAEASKKWFYFGLFLLVLISSSIITFLVRKNYKNHVKIASEKLEKEQIQKQLLDEKMRINEEETKRLIADNTMRLAFKQELLDRLKSETASIKTIEDMKASMQSLMSKLQLQISTESKLSWIQDKIEDVNKGFDAKLRTLYPKLTKIDREICALMRLNLSIKEIATIRDSSIDAVKAARYRIRKKMNLSAGEELEYVVQSL